MRDSFATDPRHSKAFKDLQQAVSCQRQGRLAEAEKLYARVTKKNPQYFDALHLYGLFKYQLGQFNDAARLVGSATKVNPRSANALNSLGVILAHLKRHQEAIASFEAALRLEPNHVQALGNQSNSLNELGRFLEAIGCADRALTIARDYAEAYIPRGAALLGSNRYVEALESYDSALTINPSLAIAWAGRGNSCHKLGRYGEAFAAFDKAIALKPDLADGWLGRGNVLFSHNRDPEALLCYDKAIALKQDLADGYFNKSLLKLSLGDYREGWQLYEWRWKKHSFSSPVRNFGQPVWLGDGDLSNKTILIHSEQGFGDTIQFYRYISLLEGLGCEIIFETQAALVPLVNAQGCNVQVIGQGSPLPKFDIHCPLLSLPLAFKTTLDAIPASIPYLVAAPEKQRLWRAKLGEKSKPRIGLAWSGNLVPDFKRSIPLEHLLPIMSGDVEWHSLQEEVRANDHRVLELNPEIVQHARFLTDFSETAALITELDLVISIDTAVAHLAGALGKPVWILLPFHPDFRWLRDRQDSPWYPTARLFRQTKDGDWSDVLGKISNELRALNINV